jgi:plastocyanin
VVVAQHNGTLTYANADPTAVHNFVAERVYGATTKPWCSASQRQNNTCPLFWSATIGIGQTPVLGLDQAAGAGTPYPFFCTVHPNMKGTLAVI